MKLVNLGHAQSKETRMKIGVGVRMGWERRRETLMLQETCYFEWQNLIVEASRKGFVGEEELRWDSYKILDSQLEQEWLESVEQRKKMLRIKGNKKAPKPLEQRRKISEAISAKWADPVYRERVCHALANYHGTPVGAEKKLRRRPSGKSQPRTPSPKNHKAKDADNSFGYVSESQEYHMRLSRHNKPLYKDPLASSKLEMIKNIRAQRASAETKKTEAIEQAKLLIAEAEKAAKALEAAAMRSPLAQASLIETRKLIAEAIQSIRSIEIGQIDSHEIGRSPLISSMELANHVEENNSSILGLSQTGQREINVVQAMESSKSVDLGFGMFNFQDLLNGKDEILPITSGGYGLVNGKEELCQTGPGDYGLAPSEVQSKIKLGSKGNNSHAKRLIRSRAELLSRKEETQPNSITITKKWVRGRLVEIMERD